jgi:hypothetical protein
MLCCRFGVWTAKFQLMFGFEENQRRILPKIWKMGRAVGEATRSYSMHTLPITPMTGVTE